MQGGAEEVLTLPQEAASGWKQEMGSLPPEACKEEGDPPPYSKGHLFTMRVVPARRVQRVNTSS